MVFDWLNNLFIKMLFIGKVMLGYFKMNNLKKLILILFKIGRDLLLF